MKTTTYLLRDVDVRLWRKVRDRAKAEGVSVRFLLVQMLTLYADGRVALVAVADDDAPFDGGYAIK